MKLNRLDSNVQGPVEMSAHYVSVPYIIAFAGKEGKEWFVYEYSTGLKITGAGAKTKDEAVKLATDRLLEYGQDEVKQAISTKKIIN